jgi:conserved oligomeric Golgi complex subunit 1
MKLVDDIIQLDRHLYTLQVLSAHMKILLDAPEHLWRLIERKKYLPAAWLFLLASVVYQALRNDDTDEQSWINEGIDVLVRVTFEFKHKLE